MVLATTKKTRKMKYTILYAGYILFTLFACSKSHQDKNIEVHNSVQAKYETEPVMATNGDDAADDPAIWVNKQNPGKSRIIGTNKKAGLHVYDLKGNNLFFTPVGLVNNVDLREYNNNIIVGASNRSFNGITLMKFDPASDSLFDISADTVYSNVDEVYGFCMYNQHNTNQLYAFVNGKDGNIEQYLLQADNDKFMMKMIRKLHVPTQPEGMVVDDELGFLYVGEEACCVWKFYAHPDSTSVGWKIKGSEVGVNANIVPDIEGVSLFKQDGSDGFLFISTQGANSFGVFQREAENQYLGSFSVIDGSVDGCQETDGIDVVSDSLNSDFPNGVLVVQDGFNFDNEVAKPQNFKLISVKDIFK